MASSYRMIEDDEVIIVDLNSPYAKIACCDCGLVHYWTFGLKAGDDGRILLQLYIDRAERPTAQLRRNGNCGLLRGDHKKWKMERIE